MKTKPFILILALLFSLISAAPLSVTNGTIRTDICTGSGCYQATSTPAAQFHDNTQSNPVPTETIIRPTPTPTPKIAPTPKQTSTLKVNIISTPEPYLPVKPEYKAVLGQAAAVYQKPAEDPYFWWKVVIGGILIAGGLFFISLVYDRRKENKMQREINRVVAQEWELEREAKLEQEGELK